MRKNKRKYPRIEVEVQILVQTGSGSESIETRTKNVGAGGISVKLDSFLEAQTPVTVVLELPDNLAPLETAGRVAWCVQERKMIGRRHPAYDTGISFTDLNTGQRERLIRFAQEIPLLRL